MFYDNANAVSNLRCPRFQVRKDRPFFSRRFRKVKEKIIGCYQFRARLKILREAGSNSSINS
ncbi:hypothetical protein LEP1GSC039_1817 [Leptospira santarosai str. 2000027870]|nr:hypothetical protein LEP1GSC039_1817 [Leptospira santarosai str. 2000027870]